MKQELDKVNQDQIENPPIERKEKVTEQLLVDCLLYTSREEDWKRFQEEVKQYLYVKEGELWIR